MVFYRKYRPQTIEELDSKAVRDALTTVLSGKSIPHAFLFTGPKGLGKTSTARIVAKVVNCEVNSKVKTQKSKSQVKSQKFENQDTKDKRPTTNDQIEPCNKCYQCTSITNGTNIDVLEIDGASNRGIDEIRDLREKVRLSPAGAFRKVYIIDEVHMLTTEAFNALLKTLEEPPMHVIFILCTTEPHKVPATIVSRCFQITFKKATIEELVRSFKRIGEFEKLSIDNETLNIIASLSDGSFRDGVKILEETALKANGKKITKDVIEERYQMSNISSSKEKMIGFLEKRDTKEALFLVTELVEYGIDIKYFIEKLIEDLHKNLLSVIGVSGYEKKSLVNLDPIDIKKLVELLAKAHAGLKYAVLPQLPLELAIVEWSLHQAQESVTQLSSRPSPTKRGAWRDLSQQSLDAGDSSTSPASRDSLEMTNKGHVQLWQELIDKVKLYNHSIAGVLRGCKVISYDKDKLVIEAGFKFHKERLEENNNLAILNKVSSEIAGNKIEVSVVLRK